MTAYNYLASKHILQIIRVTQCVFKLNYIWLLAGLYIKNTLLQRYHNFAHAVVWRYVQAELYLTIDEHKQTLPP